MNALEWKKHHHCRKVTLKRLFKTLEGIERDVYAGKVPVLTDEFYLDVFYLKDLLKQEEKPWSGLSSSLAQCSQPPVSGVGLGEKGAKNESRRSP